MFRPALEAYAGPDQKVLPGTMVTLDGSNSAGTPFEYKWWVKEAPPGGEVTYLTSVDQATVQVKCDGDGVYQFTLRVTRNYAQDWDTVKIHVGRPVADAGPDKNTLLGSAAVLEGTDSQSHTGAPLTYKWWIKDAPPEGQITYFGSTSQPNLQVRGSRIGDYEFTLRVTENGVHDWDTAVMTVEHPPFALVPAD
jgi:hypothetical protein